MKIKRITELSELKSGKYIRADTTVIKGMPFVNTFILKGVPFKEHTADKLWLMHSDSNKFNYYVNDMIIHAVCFKYSAKLMQFLTDLSKDTVAFKKFITRMKFQYPIIRRA